MSLQFKTYAKAQRGFAKWVHTAHVPSFAEYMEIGVVEDAAYAAIACYFMCLGKLATKEAYEWLESRPKLVQSITIKLRLVNDIYGFEVKIWILFYFFTSQIYLHDLF